MLEIIYGLDNTNRDELAYAKIQKIADSGEQVWILVPEQFSLSTEKLIIKKFGISSQVRIKVITFSRLCNLVLSKLGPLRMQYIDGAGKQIIAARTVRKLKGKLSVLSQGLRRKGFSSAIVDIVSEFKRYGVSPEQIDSLCVGDTELSEKMADISMILKTYNSFIEQQASDAEDNLESIIPRLDACDFLKGNLFIMHFRTFTPVEYRAINGFMQKMNLFAVMCCDDIHKSSALFSPVAATCRTLLENAGNIKIESTERAASILTQKSIELSHLTDNYFASRPKPYVGNPDDIKIFELSGTYREVEAAADLILNLCRTEGRKFSDFLILARNTAAYNRIMPAIFSSRGIDVFLDTKRSILTKPLIEMLCAALDIISYGYSYERVMTIARSGMRPVHDSDIDLFENYLLAVSPTHAMWSEQEWSYCPDGYDIEKINQTRHALLDFVEKIKNSLSGRKTAGQICRAICDTLKEDNIDSVISAVCNKFSKQDMPYLADEYKQIRNHTIMLLNQISTLMDDENITWQDFGDLFKSACGGISVGLTPQTQGSVVFSQIDMFRSNDTPIVIVLGMTDGVFPLAHTSEGILSDTERAKLLKYDIVLAPSADSKRREEQLLIYSVLSAPKEKIYLFTPLMGSDGKPLEQSPILKKIRTKIFPDISVFNPDASDDGLKFSEGRSAAFDILCSHLAECGGDVKNLNKSGQALMSYFKDIPEFSGRLEKLIKNMNLPANEKLSKETVKKIYGETIMLSASKLEKFNSCAFSYFMNYGLLASKRDMAGIEPRSTGSIQHAALYRYFSELKESETDYSEITMDNCYDKIYSIVKEEALQSTELLYESSSYYKYVVTRMQGIASRTAWEVVKFFKSSKFRPLGFEIKINTGEKIPAIEITNNDNKKIALLRGIIDRADSAIIDGKTYISIIDYKSSERKLDERLTEAGVHLQPLLYSDIVCRRLNANPAAMLYMQMTDPIVDGSKLKKGITHETVEKAVHDKVSLCGWLNNDAKVLSGYSTGGDCGEKFITASKSSFIDETEMKERIAQANLKIKQSAIEISEGNVDVNPYIDKGYNACTHCPYSLSCGIDLK